MTKQQAMVMELFNMVKEEAEYKKLSQGMAQYTWKEAGWRYDFFTADGELKKAEGSNHRELIEVWF